MKKIFLISTILMSFIFGRNVFAKASFYLNDYGVSFTKEEYDFLSNFYFEGYQNYMSKNDYDEFIKSNILNQKIQIKTTDGESEIMPLADVTHSTNKKSIKLSSACSGMTCEIAITLSWLQSPIIRSYDLIGSYIENGNLVSRGSSYLYYNNSTRIFPIEQRDQYNALSSTFKLPSNGEKIYIIERFTVSNSGKITASYQHSMYDITLLNSRNYSFSTNGYGGVFLFNSGIANYYDGMLGVYLILS